MIDKSNSSARKPAPSTLTLSEAIEQFIQRPRSRDARGARAIQRSSIGGLKVAGLNRSVILRWCEERLQSVKLSTVQSDLRVIRLSIELARDEYGVKLANNPASGINLNDPDRVLTDEEALELYRALERWPLLRALVIVAAETGVRRGGITTLRWRDVDLEDAVLNVRRGQDGSVAHTVPLSPLAVEALRTVPRRGHRVFLMPVDRLQWVWAAATRRAGLRGVKFWEPQHVLRRQQARTN